MWGIILDRESELPIKRQIYQAIRDWIMSGQLKSGETLPSTRELAKSLNVSRNTVCEAYEMLLAEGYITSRQGAPTRVTEGLCIEKLPDCTPSEKEVAPPPLRADFRTGRPDLRLFPRFLWQQMLHQAGEEMPLDNYGYTGPQGLPELRYEIAAWLFRSRGLIVDPQDIFITAGATHALHLIAELLSRQGQEILMEDPCHSGMLQTFINKGCPIIPVPVDSQGLQTEYLTGGQNACAVYVTPSHQFPLGGILPASRRAELIRFARENVLYIIEDDYDSEFRYGGEPIAPLLAMDSRHVIYVGTFSKIMFPALRIGYVVLPPPLHKRWRDLRTHTDVQNPPFEQAALAEFLRTRKLDRHIQKMRRVYGERRRVLLESLQDVFGSEWTAFGDVAGLHLAIEFPGGYFDTAFKQYCLQKGIYITPLEQHCIQNNSHQSKLLVGYGHLEPEEIRSSIKLLREVVKEKTTKD
jgi:GntR family transcriptional regulator/MocR family aminotransferase